ncbi:MAG: 50S ribosomal protein L11 methyltransferase [Clostridiales bacterium]|nr:50S ribosomal protein L11 methyltransferase [Clostridiales bacterium]
MKWIKLSVDTTTEAVDFISSLFDELGLEGIEIEDKVPLSEEEKKQMFIDILPELGPDDGTATVSSYVKEEDYENSLKDEIEKGLSELRAFVDVGTGQVTVSVKDDQDWVNNWKKYFKPFRVAEDIVIKPTWETLEKTEPDDLVIEIDPGTAFGTGSHETTRLCIESIRKYITKETVLLDVGCGSGILSIIAMKLGAKRAVATDIDAEAIRATKENMEVNHIPEEKITTYTGNIIDEKALQENVGYGCYDLVVANILADIIIPLSGEIAQHMKKDGLFVSSGIIDMKRDEVREALLSNGFEIVEENMMKDWVSFVAKKTEV